MHNVPNPKPAFCEVAVRIGCDINQQGRNERNIYLQSWHIPKVHIRETSIQRIKNVGMLESTAWIVQTFKQKDDHCTCDHFYNIWITSFSKSIVAWKSACK